MKISFEKVTKNLTSFSGFSLKIRKLIIINYVDGQNPSYKAGYIKLSLIISCLTIKTLNAKIIAPIYL